MEVDKATRLFVAISEAIALLEAFHSKKEDWHERTPLYTEYEKLNRLRSSLGYNELKRWLENGGRK